MYSSQEICPVKFAEAMNYPNEQRYALLAKLGAKFMKADLSLQEEDKVTTTSKG